MATPSTSPSSLMLTYAASTANPQDLTSSLLSFKPKSFSLINNPLLLLGDRKASLNFYSQREPKLGTCSLIVAASALAAEADVAEDVEGGEGGGDGATATAVAPPKPKKGKAALPLKRDRVCFSFLKN